MRRSSVHRMHMCDVINFKFNCSIRSHDEYATTTSTNSSSGNSSSSSSHAVHLSFSGNDFGLGVCVSMRTSGPFTRTKPNLFNFTRVFGRFAVTSRIIIIIIAIYVSVSMRSILNTSVYGSVLIRSTTIRFRRPRTSYTKI